MIGEPAPPTLTPPQVAVYPVVGNPLAAPGAKATVMLAFPAIADVMEGALGLSPIVVRVTSLPVPPV
jgi:hypothetical protein